jgi:hypothetical protein
MVLSITVLVAKPLVIAPDRPAVTIAMVAVGAVAGATGGAGDV